MILALYCADQLLSHPSYSSDKFQSTELSTRQTSKLVHWDRECRWHQDNLEWSSCLYQHSFFWKPCVVTGCQEAQAVVVNDWLRAEHAHVGIQRCKEGHDRGEALMRRLDRLSEYVSQMDQRHTQQMNTLCQSIHWVALQPVQRPRVDGDDGGRG